MGNAVMSLALNAAFSAANAVLALDSDITRRLSVLEGRALRVEITGLDLKFNVFARGHKLAWDELERRQVDVILRGPPFSLLRMMNAREKWSTLFSREVNLQGSQEVAQGFHDLFQYLDIDWEGAVARITGDLIAHEIGHLTRSFISFGKQGLHKLQQDVAEHLHEKAEVSPYGFEMEAHITAVSQLRTDQERLEARIAQLKLNLAKGDGR